MTGTDLLALIGKPRYPNTGREVPVDVSRGESLMMCGVKGEDRVAGTRGEYKIPVYL